MTNHDGLLIDAETVAGELRKRGDAWADLDSAYRALEDTQKSILAEAFLKVGDGSVAEREAKARASAIFGEHLASLDRARHAANKARVAYDVYKVYVELLRTNSSSQRALVELR